MVILYAMVRSLTVLLRKATGIRHRRAKENYEQLKVQFRDLENECKAEEVSVGRPVDYTAQLRLLKLFELVEKARRRWIRMATRLKRRERLEAKVASIGGRKIPYTSGLIDMALVFKLLDLWTIWQDFGFRQWTESLFASWF